MIDLELINLVEELYCCCDYFETYFMLLDLFLFLDLFWDLFCAFGFFLVVEFIYFETYFILLDFIWLLDLFYELLYVAHLPYFAINYNVEFNNLLIILFFTNLFATHSFIYFYDKSNIILFFCNT